MKAPIDQFLGLNELNLALLNRFLSEPPHQPL